MANPVFATAGTGDAGTGLSGAPGYPSGITSGDLLLMQVVIVCTVDDETVSTPGGWVLETGPFQQEFETKAYLFSRIADGSETGTLSLTYSGTPDAKGARIYRFTGNATSSFVEGASSDGDTGTSIAMNTVTTTGIDRLAVTCIGVGANTTVASSTGESGGDWTEAIAEFSSAAGVTLQLQTAVMATAGSITGGTSAIGTSATGVTNSLAIKPFVAPPANIPIAWITA